jgi:nucleoside-diphosphate-sugar epimerase
VATLLTGAGYIGAALLRRLDTSAAPVVALDNFYSTPREAIEAALPSGTTLIEGDVARASDVARAFDALGGATDVVVYHLAAQPSAAMAVAQPETTERTNLTGARVVLEAARERRARVIFGSSFRVYGDHLTGECVDERTPYGRVGDLSHLSKIYVEQLARMIGGQFVSVRLGVTYGLSPIMKTGSPAFMTVPNLFCQRAAQGEVLQVLEDRPLAFVHVDDAAAALVTSAACRDVTWQVINAAPEVATIGQLARVVQLLMHSRRERAQVLGATGTQATFEVRSRMDLQPGHTLATGLGEVLDFFLARR